MRISEGNITAVEVLVASRKVDDLFGANEPKAGQPNSRILKDMFYVASGNDLQMPSDLDFRTFLPSEISLIMRQNPPHCLSPDSLCSSLTASGSHVRRNRSAQMAISVAR